MLRENSISGELVISQSPGAAPCFPELICQNNQADDPKAAVPCAGEIDFRIRRQMPSFKFIQRNGNAPVERTETAFYVQHIPFIQPVLQVKLTGKTFCIVILIISLSTVPD